MMPQVENRRNIYGRLQSTMRGAMAEIRKGVFQSAKWRLRQ